MTTSTCPHRAYFIIQVITVDTVGKDPGEVLILPLVQHSERGQAINSLAPGPHGK